MGGGRSFGLHTSTENPGQGPYLLLCYAHVSLRTAQTRFKFAKFACHFQVVVSYSSCVHLLTVHMVLGAGEDVCREVSAVADQVIVAARSWKNPEWASDPRPFGPRGNVSRRGMVSTLHPDGKVEFTQVMVAHAP